MSILPRVQSCIFRSVRLHANGGFAQKTEYVHSTIADAEKRLRKSLRSKTKRAWVQVDFADAPPHVLQHMPVARGMNAHEAVELMGIARRERYCTFVDTDGMEGWFDFGVSYLCYACDDGFYKVFANDGCLRTVFAERLGTIEPTERAIGGANGLQHCRTSTQL